ncbi:MAG: thymidine kinase [Metamycoplasmataceae bacterium]
MLKKSDCGIIEVITGPMFSGKSEELIKRITILSYAEIKTLVIKPSFDNRFSNNKIISRNGKVIKSFVAKNVKDIRDKLDDSYKVIVIDEAQFFDNELVDFIQELVNKGIHVIISGLDLDFRMKPFGIMPSIFAIADKVDKLKAVCINCKKEANASFRKSNSIQTKKIGDLEEYEARCRKCHNEGEKLKNQKNKN